MNKCFIKPKIDLVTQPPIYNFLGIFFTNEGAVYSYWSVCRTFSINCFTLFWGSITLEFFPYTWFYLPKNRPVFEQIVGANVIHSNAGTA